MKKIIFISMILLSACTHLTASEQHQLRELKSQGIDVDHAQANWQKPASPATAGVLNLLPGIGNFYLACGNGAQSEHALYGVLNLLTWPISILWGIPEAAIDANVINQRELIYYYTYEHKPAPTIRKKQIRQQPNQRQPYNTPRYVNPFMDNY